MWRIWLTMAVVASIGCGQSTATPRPTPAAAQTALAAPPAPQVPGAPRGAPAAEAKPRRKPGQPGVDWPTFLGPTGDSKSPEKGILTKWPAEGPRIVWQRKLGEGYGIGSIAKGKLYQADRIDDKARLVCLNAETGEELWKKEYVTTYVDMYDYDGGPRCSPIVDGDRVYMYGVEGLLLCHDADTGDVKWKKDVSSLYNVVQNFFGVGSTPVIEGDLILVMVGGSPADGRPSVADAEPDGTAIVAFNKLTGDVVYKLGDDLASYASLKLATIGDRRWCFAFCRAGLLAFEPTKGKVDFHYPWRAKLLESVNASMPVVAGKQVLISECYGPGSSLLEVTPGDFKVTWADDARKREKSLQTHWNTPIEVDGYVYGSSGRHTENAELRCIELKTGEVMWSEPGLTRSSLLYADGHFLSLGEYGQLQLLKANPKKYDLVAEVLLRDDSLPALPGNPSPPLLKYPAWAAPVLSHGLLYVRGKDRLVCLELIEGN